MTFNDALALLKSEIEAGFILDFYVTNQSIIAVTDQGEFVFWSDVEPSHDPEEGL
jgi:hypothetical protein